MSPQAIKGAAMCMQGRFVRKLTPFNRGMHHTMLAVMDKASLVQGASSNAWH